MNSTPTTLEKYPELAPLFAELRTVPDRLLQTTKEMLSGEASALFITDFFMIGALKRSIDLVEAIADLANKWNFVAAAPLVRIHLDTLLRVSYVIEEPDGDSVAEAAFHGRAFNSQQAANGD